MLKKKVSCVDCTSTNCLIKNCSKELLLEVDKHKIVSKYAKNQIIFHEDNLSDEIYFIYSGVVKVFKNGSFNKNKIVRFSLNGDILGHRGLSQNTYPISAETITATEIHSLTKEYFFTLLNKSPQLATNLMIHFSEELNRRELGLRNMAVFNVREKVVKALLMLIHYLGVNENAEINYLTFFNRQTIADIVGIKANQVTKVLTNLKKENLIEIKGKSIKILSKEKLKEIISF